MSESTSSPNGAALRPGDAARRYAEGLHDLIRTLRDVDIDAMVPTVRDGVIVPGRFGGAPDLPVGWRDEQSPGRYGFHRANDERALVHAYEPPDPPAIVVPPRAGIGTGATEAPRGLPLPQDEADERATILRARIVSPTPQNRPTIEHDLRRVVQAGVDLDDDWQGRRVPTARNPNQCISYAAHFLDASAVRS